MFDLEELIIDNTEFSPRGGLGIPEQCAKLKIVSAENSTYMFFRLGKRDSIKEINLKNNFIYHHYFNPIYRYMPDLNFMPVHYYKSDSIDIQLEKIDLRNNYFNFGSLWLFANLQRGWTLVSVQDSITGYWHSDTVWNYLEDIYRNPQVNILLSPQNPIYESPPKSHC